MDTINIVLCGLGGQGILFMTKVLAEDALRRKIPVLGAETHGMAQRGGSVVSHLRMGNAKSSLVSSGQARFLLALDPWEAYRNLPFLAPGGFLFANAPEGGGPAEEVKIYLDKLGVETRITDAGMLARKIGAPLSTNLALLGFFSSFSDGGPFSHEGLHETISLISPERFRETNLKVFEAGFEQGAKRS